MAQAFNLTAQLNLQAPGNVNQVMNQIRRQLKPIGVQVNIQNAKNLAQANSSLNSFNKNAQASTRSMNQLNRTLQESARRFSVITLATGSFLALANSFKNSVKEAVAFERELVKISQVTGKSVGQLKSLSDEVTRLGTSLGASSSDLLNVARTLTQAGFAASDTRAALDILAKTSLGATFDNIQDTTEGAIALLRQFGNEAKSVGSDVKFLENSLDAINAVSKRFAVESADLVTAIRRTGGVFSAAGGSVNELIALFTSVRATTRESAETIATGLRTIFTRIQRPESITQLRNFGIELQDAQGNFVGAFEAFKRLSQGLRGLDARSTAFSQIVEDLGGFRQVGKVIPLIQQFTTAQDALNVAQGASGSVAKDAETAQQSLGVQIQKTREQFDALIRKFVDSSAFRSLATGGLELAKAFINIADSLEPLLPMLITLAGLKLGRGLAPALGSFVGIGKSVSGTGPVTKFATGGIVPGTGNRDTVPAMLTPGEFVIRKSSVNKIGAGNLAAMNAGRQKYATGGAVELSRNSATVQDLIYRGKRNISKKRGVDFDKSKNMFTEDDTFTSDISKNTISPQKRVVDRLEPKTKSALLNSKNTAAQGDAFERYLVESGRMTSPKGFGGNNPFDGKSGNELIEVKRTAVADSILLDKNLRHQLKTGNKLNKSKLSGGSDNIKLPPMTELELNKASVESLAQEYKTAKNKKTKKSDPVENKLGDANFAFGGLVQKYAAGGIIQAKKAGAAILDPEAKNSYAENVTVNDVKKEFGRAATGVKFARGKDPFSKRFQATKFDVTTSGLNKETSDKFKATLNDSLVAGLDYAGASLGADLGVGAVTVDKSTKDNFINSLRAAQIGDAFENILSTFNNKGVFDSATDPNRPFDFPNGLTSPLADNFDGLPKAFVDAKSSAAAASKDNLRGKILDQIKSELIADGIYNDSPLFKAPRKKALGGIIQKFAEGGVAEAQKAAYIFDFDDTLGTTEAKGFKDFNNPKFIENALATRYASLAKRRASQGDDIHVLTARYGSKGIIQAIQNFMSKNGIPAKSVMAVGGAFPNEREPGKRPGTTRKLGTASKKAKILSKLAKNYSNITFLDDNAENLLKAGQVEGVKAVEAEESKLFKKYAKGGAASDTVPALLTPGEFVFNKDAAQSIGYSNLNRMNKQGVQGYAKGGAVGVQRFAVGGEPKLQPQGGNFGAGVFNPFIDVMAEAEAQVEKNIQAKKEEEEATKKASDSVEELSDSVSTPKDKLKDFSGRLAEGAEKFQKVTQSAQSFVFLASSVTALTSQFSKLEETTKTAINRTATEFAALVGILGTFGDIITSLILLGNRKIQTDLQEKVATDQSAQSEVREKVASDQAAAADAREKVASDAVAASDAKRAAAGGVTAGAGAAGAIGGGVGGAASKAGSALGKFGSALLALVGGPIGLTIAALTGLYLLFRFQANKQKAEFEKLGNAAQDLTNKFIESGEGLASTRNALISAGQVDVDRRISQLGTARANAAMSKIPALGPEAPVNVAADETIDRLNKEIDNLQKNGLNILTAEIISITGSFSELKQSVTAQSEAFDRLSSGVLTEEERSQQRKDLLTGKDGGIQTGSDLTSDIRRIALNETINRDLFKDLKTVPNIDIQGALEDPTKAGEEYANTFRLLKIQTESLGEVQKKAARNIQESTNLLNSELQKITSSDQINLDDEGSGVGQAFKVLKDNIEAEANARKANLLILKSLTGDEELKKQYTAQIASINKATQERIAAEKENIDKIKVIIDDRAAAAEKEIEQRRAFIDNLEKIQRNRLALEARTTAIQEQAAKDQRRFDAQRGELSTGVKATELTQDLSGVFDSKVVKKELNAIIKELDDTGASAKDLRRAMEAAAQIKDFTKVYDRLIKRLEGESDKGQIAGIINSELANMAPEMRKAIIENLQKAMDASTTGRLGVEGATAGLSEFSDTIKAQVSTVEAATESNQAAFDANSAALERNRQRIEEEAQKREGLISVFNKLEDTATEVDELLARSRGRDTNTEADAAVRQSRSQLKVQRELIDAEERLKANGIASAKALVGNVSELQKLKKQYQGEIDNLSQTDDKLKKNQDSIDGLNRKIKALDAELDRTANSFSAIDSLMGAMNDNIALIEKERNARSQMISVLEQFVVGSQDVRQNLAQAARGVQFAYGTGTLQNQTPEQRQATVGLLDQLSDVNIAGAFRSAITGEMKEGTGANIKQELVFRDAIRMGLDPEIAKQLATATSKEEKLIQANENLAAQINNLAGVMTAAAVAIAGNAGAGFMTGGPVQYRANGGTIFKPKGTDTVPAMLTPGEFVIRKSAVDKVGLGTLQAINNGGDAVGLAKGGPVYLDDGGSMPHRHPHRDYEGGFMWLSETENDKAQREQSAMHSQIGEDVKYTHASQGRIPQNDTLASIGNVVMGGANMAKAAIDSVPDVINEGRAGLASGADALTHAVLDPASSEIFKGLDSFVGGPEKRRLKKQQQIQDRNNFEERVYSKVLKEQAEATERFQKQQADARKAREDYYKANPIDYSKFDFENFGKTGAGFGTDGLKEEPKEKNAGVLGSGGVFKVDDDISLAGKKFSPPAPTLDDLKIDQELAEQNLGTSLESFQELRDAKTAVSNKMLDNMEAERQARIEQGKKDYIADQQNKLSKDYQDKYVNPSDSVKMETAVADRILEMSDKESRKKAGLTDEFLGTYTSDAKRDEINQPMVEARMALSPDFEAKMRFEGREQIEQTDPMFNPAMTLNPAALNKETGQYNNRKTVTTAFGEQDAGLESLFTKRTADTHRAEVEAAAKFDPFDRFEFEEGSSGRGGAFIERFGASQKTESQLERERKDIELRNKVADAMKNDPRVTREDTTRRRFDGGKINESKYTFEGEEISEKALRRKLEQEIKKKERDGRRSAQEYGAAEPLSQAVIKNEERVADSQATKDARRKELEELSGDTGIIFGSPEAKERYYAKLAAKEARKNAQAEPASPSDLPAPSATAAFESGQQVKVEDLLKESKNTANAQAASGSSEFSMDNTAYDTSDDDLFRVQTGSVTELNFGQNTAGAQAPKRYLPDNDPALVAFRKKQAEAQTEETTSVSTAIQRGGAAARMRERLTGRKTFTDPSRAAGSRTYTSEATKPTTSAKRQKQRVAQQRKAFAVAQAKEDSEFDVDAFRRARGMRSRGRNPDGSKMNGRQQYGGNLGGGFMNFLSGYGGYGNQMMGGGYGNQMVPFGYIPGSPYNSMLGGGIYNIPMFDKRLMFGNMARFFANGGAAGGDTVPAMLTPGEFVMSKNAVSKYGTGFMQNLNRGKIQGFNKGGPVQYRQTGGIMDMLGGAAQSLGIDTSKIEGVFGGFVDNFSSVFDNIMGPFNAVAESLRQMSESFGNFTMQHNVNVEGMISLGGLNVESIKNELSKSIGEMVADEVTKAMDSQNKTFKSN